MTTKPYTVRVEVEVCAHNPLEAAGEARKALADVWDLTYNVFDHAHPDDTKGYTVNIYPTLGPDGPEVAQ